MIGSPEGLKDLFFTCPVSIWIFPVGLKVKGEKAATSKGFLDDDI